MQKNARVAVISIIGAVILTFLFSAAMFRPLRHVSQMLDMVAKGEYEPEKPASKSKATDELSLMASKVSLLSQRLRGAQYEVSDLRGNIDRLLQDLEDAVFIFNREQRLVFASGSVEKFLGKRPRRSARPIHRRCFPAGDHAGTARSAGAPRPGGRCATAGFLWLPPAMGPARPWFCFRWTCWRPFPAARKWDRACWCACAIRRRSARSAASCRRPTAWPL